MEIRNTKSPAILPRKRMNLSPFNGLAIRSNPSNWARASKPPTIDTEVAIKASDTDFYGREQVLSPCLMGSITPSNDDNMKANDDATLAIDYTAMEAVMKHAMKPMKVSNMKNMKNITRVLIPYLRLLHSA